MKTANFPTMEFETKKRLNPYWSSYTCFANVIDGKKKLSIQTIKKYFDSLVEKTDYSNTDKQNILNHLIEISGGGESEKNTSRLGINLPQTSDLRA